jgi:hypothetical protein
MVRVAGEANGYGYFPPQMVGLYEMGHPDFGAKQVSIRSEGRGIAEKRLMLRGVGVAAVVHCSSA